MAAVEDFERCYEAIKSRDARFDGWFFTAVTSTGIYCRPSCPARTPMAAHVRFYPTAAAAQHAGFRACLRCRPDAAPGSPEWLGRADVAARALRLVFDGVVDREGVAGLAGRLGYSERQLHRVLVAEVGTGALALARAQRAQTARLLLETTPLPIAQVAFGAGFASVRQFNDTVRAVFGRTPTELRRSAARRDGGATARRRSSSGRHLAAANDWAPTVRVRMAYRQPYAADELFTFIGSRSVPGVEEWRDGAYRRTLRLARGHGIVTLAPADGHVDAAFALADLRDLSTAIARCRHLCNLDADPQSVDRALGADPALAESVTRRPGLRVPGTVDGFETAVRAVVGQQVSVAGARTVLGGLVAAAGEQLARPSDGLTHVFPGPGATVRVAAERPQAFAMPAARRNAIVALAEAVADGSLVIDPGASPAELRAALVALPGIGPWTAEYVAMRGLGDPDSFLPTDLGTRRGAAERGIGDEPRVLMAHAEGWRPWRSYAQMHLWTTVATDKPATTDWPKRKAAVA